MRAVMALVLNKYGDGDEESIAAGLRFAADQGAQIIKATARDLGAPGADHQHGAGMIDAGAATAR